MIRIAIFGAAGRMGSALEDQVSKCNNGELVGLVDKEASQDRQSGFITLDELAETKPQVVIDFSSPDGAVAAAQWCAKHGVALVTGTTGLAPGQEEEIRLASKKVPVLSSPNMSSGLNAMCAAVAKFLESFTEGEVIIEDIHHRHKKDTPSGTAKFLETAVRENLRSPAVLLPTNSVRAGDVFGVHRVSFFAEGEWLTFEHQATGREVFARGAVQAALWLAGQKPGLYKMQDFLGRR